jgi:hypothetical protein
MQGRIVQQTEGNDTKQNRTIIPVDALPAGTYILKVTGETGAGILRVFVVQH